MNFDDCRNNADRDKYGLCAAGLGKCESDCVFYMRTKKPTNADRIRSMSDIELAELIAACEAAGYADASITPCLPNGYHMEVIDWLRQPATK